jgi:hypothetical protein
MNEQDVSTQILSDITVYMKYARYLPESNAVKLGMNLLLATWKCI